MQWPGRYDFAARPAKGQNFICLQRCQPVASLRAEKLDTRNKFLTWRCVFTLLFCWTVRGSGCNHYLPTKTQYYSDALSTSGFALRAAEERKFAQYSQQCANMGVQFIPIAFESFGGFSELVRKTLEQIALLTENRSIYPAGLSVAFSRLAQLVLVTLMRGNTIMLIARGADLGASCKSWARDSKGDRSYLDCLPPNARG